jgi:hypothetical protein
VKARALPAIAVVWAAKCHDQLRRCHNLHSRQADDNDPHDLNSATNKRGYELTGVEVNNTSTTPDTFTESTGSDVRAGRGSNASKSYLSIHHLFSVLGTHLNGGTDRADRHVETDAFVKLRTFRVAAQSAYIAASLD